MRERCGSLLAQTLVPMRGHQLRPYFQPAGALDMIVPMELQPRQQPYPPLWYPTRDVDSVRQAARQRYNCATIGPAAQARQNVDIYWETWTAHQEEPDRLNSHVLNPKRAFMHQL